MSVLSISLDPMFMAWDIETAPQESFVFDAKVEYIQATMQQQCTTIICAAWRGLNGKIQTTKIDPRNPRDDLMVVTRIHKELMRCGENNVIVVHQNGDKFDLPKVVARILYWRARGYNLPTLPKIVTIDTLKKARAIGFDYKNLNYLDKYLHGENAGKVETRGWLMWDDIVSRHSSLKKRRAALREMIVYNKGDILSLERCFDTLRPEMNAFPNMNLWKQTEWNCPQCGSENVVYRSKPQMLVTLTYRKMSCNDCGRWFRETKAIKTIKPKVIRTAA